MFVPTRVVFFYFDPAKMRTPGEMGAAGMVLAARLFFEDNSLRETALKLARLIEGAASPSRPYFEALGVVLAHELARLNAGVRRREASVRGGLAGWQQRIVSTYIDEHLAEQVPLARLTQLVGLSPYYFCRAFKQSFRLPPRRLSQQPAHGGGQDTFGQARTLGWRSGLAGPARSPPPFTRRPASTNPQIE